MVLLGMLAARVDARSLCLMSGGGITSAAAWSGSKFNGSSAVASSGDPFS